PLAQCAQHCGRGGYPVCGAALWTDHEVSWSSRCCSCPWRSVNPFRARGVAQSVCPRVEALSVGRPGVLLLVSVALASVEFRARVCGRVTRDKQGTPAMRNTVGHGVDILPL